MKLIDLIEILNDKQKEDFLKLEEEIVKTNEKISNVTENTDKHVNFWKKKYKAKNFFFNTNRIEIDFGKYKIYYHANDNNINISFTKNSKELTDTFKRLPLISKKHSEYF